MKFLEADSIKRFELIEHVFDETTVLMNFSEIQFEHELQCFLMILIAPGGRWFKLCIWNCQFQ